MPAEIKVIAGGVGLLMMQESFEVLVGDQPIVICGCVHQAEWMARKINQANEERGQHNAMEILTQQLGLCESLAFHVLSVLKGEHTPVPIDIAESKYRN